MASRSHSHIRRFCRTSGVVRPVPCSRTRHWAHSSFRSTHSSSPHSGSQLPEVYGEVDIDQFRKDAYTPGLPLVMRRQGAKVPVPLPAAMQWFTSSSGTNAEGSLSRKLREWDHAVVDYEMLCPNPSVLDTSSPSDAPLRGFLHWLAKENIYGDLRGLLSRCIEQGYDRFAPNQSEMQLIRFSGPLAILSAALGYRAAVLASKTGTPFMGLYIAQSSLDALPTVLQADVPTPQIVTHAGKGDVYGTSIWIGLEPTYTPLHKDPNPNVFCQVCSSKAIRLISPASGASVFLTAQKNAGATIFSPRLSVEMMTGAQKAALDQVVWGKDASPDVREAVLGPGDAIFIPKGWWHSVKSVGHQGAVNGSVNWWFR